MRSCPPGPIAGAWRPVPEQASAEPPAGRRRALVLVVALFLLSLVVVIGVGLAIIR